MWKLPDYHQTWFKFLLLSFPAISIIVTTLLARVMLDHVMWFGCVQNVLNYLSEDTYTWTLLSCIIIWCGSGDSIARASTCTISPEPFCLRVHYMHVCVHVAVNPGYTAAWCTCRVQPSYSERRQSMETSPPHLLPTPPHSSAAKTRPVKASV